MKRIFEHPSEPLTGKKYWRSLGQLSDTPEFRGWLEREFPQGASEIQGGDVSRRNFLKLMEALPRRWLAWASRPCRRPTMHLVRALPGASSGPFPASPCSSPRPVRRAAVILLWLRPRMTVVRRKSTAIRCTQSAKGRRIPSPSRRFSTFTIPSGRRRSRTRVLRWTRQALKRRSKRS